MKIKKIGIAVVIVFGLIGAGYFAVDSVAQNEIKKITIHDFNRNILSDGTYQGYAKVGPVKVDVSVIVVNHGIKEIILNEHFNGLGKDAESIVTAIIEKQTLNVDSISGATTSSVCIKKAIENALEGKK